MSGKAPGWTEHQYNYGCWCHPGYLTAIGTDGQLTCHSEGSGRTCGDGGVCLDLSVISDAPHGIEEKFTCSCHWGCVLLEDCGVAGLTRVRRSHVGVYL